MKENKRITDEDIDFIDVKMSPLAYEEFDKYISNKDKPENKVKDLRIITKLLAGLSGIAVIMLYNIFFWIAFMKKDYDGMLADTLVIIITAILVIIPIVVFNDIENTINRRK